MPINTTIDVLGRFPDPKLVEEQMANPSLPKAIGDAVADVLIAHFVELNSERHKHGAFGFYEMAARSTGYTMELGYPAVVVWQTGVAQRFEGGTIWPRNVSYLAIPNSFSATITATYGHSPTEFSGLEVVFGRQNTGGIGPIALRAPENEDFEGEVFRQRHEFALVKGGSAMRKDIEGKGRKGRWIRGEYVEAGPRGKKVKNAESEILFWLCKWVYQTGDPSVLPPHDQLEEAGYAAATAWMGRNVPTSITVGSERIL